MKFIDIFSGIGGFRKGLELAGHECVGFCEFDKHAVRSYVSMHLLTDEEKNTIKQMELKQAQKYMDKEVLPKINEREWYANDVREINTGNMPSADCWCFGFPCQDISVAGRQLGFAGHRSSLFFAVTKLIRELEEKDRPQLLLIENVKNLLSVNRGFDFARLLIELDEIGYNAEWQVFNSKKFGIPHNRERVFVVAHLRKKGECKVFPVKGTFGKNNLKQMIGGSQGQRIYDANGISVTLSSQGGGSGATTGLYAIPMLAAAGIGKGITVENNARCLMARDYKGIGNQIMTSVVVPVLTPDRVNKRQNGRRFKENGDPMYTLTSQDRHGVMFSVNSESKNQRRCKIGMGVVVEISEDCHVYAMWNETYQSYMAVRRLTPRECFRLQGWSDEYFDLAKAVSSESQLYNQAGNGVTVTVIEAIRKKLSVNV